MNYPKIIIVTNVDYLHEVGPTANTLRSFLDEWPKDKLRLLVCKDFNVYEHENSASNVFVLSHRDIRVVSYLIKGERKPKKNTHLGFQGNVNPNLANKNLFRLYKNKFRYFLTKLYYFFPYKSFNVYKWLDGYKPELLYCCVTDYRSFKLCYQLSSRYKIPIIPHFLDDWMNTYLTEQYDSRLLRGVFEKLMGKIFSISPFGLCICDLMSKTYHSRYGIPFYSLMNSVSTVKASDIREIKQDSVTFMYAGSLYLKREESILLICKALAASGIDNIKLMIYAPKEQWSVLKHKFELYPFVQYGGFLSAKQMVGAICSSDYLLFVESFDPAVFKYSRLSMSTRIPEYMSSGKPIISVGPKEQGSIQYLVDNNAAFVATSYEELTTMLPSIFDNSLIFEKIKNAESLCRRNHLAKAQKEKFLYLVTTAISGLSQYSNHNNSNI